MFRNGYLNTGIKPLDSKVFKDAFQEFLSKDEDYRMLFLQKSFEKSVDGYSYMGQKDSLNQYNFDLLHSFVLSRFNSIESYPREFNELLGSVWEETESFVSDIERKMLTDLGDSELAEFYENHIGHMVSANYYPAISGESDQRLSEHKDVSMFTVFPFGVDGDLQFFIDGKWVSQECKDEVVAFPGYLTERVTNGRVKGTEHRVVSGSKRKKERFSFAMFSIPKPEKLIVLNGEQMLTEEYMNEYLDLF